MLLSFFLQSQETVAGVLVDNTVFWQITRGALTTFFSLGEEVNRLWFTATESNFRFVQVVSNAAEELGSTTIAASIPSTELYRKNYASPIWAPTVAIALGHVYHHMRKGIVL